MEVLATQERLKDVVFVSLRRNWVDQAASYVHRADFRNYTTVWQWYLDSSYRNAVVDPGPMRSLGPSAPILWYIAEMEARQEYYKQLYNDRFRFIGCRLEDIVRPAGAVQLLRLLGAGSAWTCT